MRAAEKFHAVSAWLVGPAAIVTAVCASTTGAFAAPVATEGEDRPKPATTSDRPVLGARMPKAGDVVLSASTGMALMLPHLSASARLGLGGGTGLGLGYRTIAGVSHKGRLSVGWGMPLGERVAVGLSARTALADSSLADGTIGFQYSALALGNDWEVGHDLLLTVRRPGQAHITLAVGPTYTLGGRRYTSYEESSFEIDPAVRGLASRIQGEWRLSEAVNLLLRLEGLTLFGLEEDEACVAAHQRDCAQVAPLGFLPTGSVGLAWALGG